MIKDVGAVAIVLIIVLGALLYVWTDRRRSTRRSTLKATQSRADLAERTLANIHKELVLQDQARRTDLYPIHVLLNEYDVEHEKLVA